MNREEKYLEEEEARQEATDQQINYDQSMGQQRNYPSDMMPQDYFQYKKMVIVPEAQTDYPSILDKDVVLANLSRNELEQHTFQVGTIQAVKDIFVHEEDIITLNPATNKPIIERTIMFDQSFNPVLNILLTQFKYHHIASRALGDTRAAMLDAMTISRIMKEFTKKKKSGERAVGV